MSSAKNHRIRSHRNHRSNIATVEHFQNKQLVKMSQKVVAKKQRNAFHNLLINLFRKKGDK